MGDRDLELTEKLAELFSKSRRPGHKRCYVDDTEMEPVPDTIGGSVHGFLYQTYRCPKCGRKMLGPATPEAVEKIYERYNKMATEQSE